MKQLNEILQSYANAFLDLVNEKIDSTNESIKQALRINKEQDWSFIRTSMDIVDDASDAIGNFLKFGLDGPTKYDESGERYLRLYGLLNATYIQQRAVRTLYELNRLPHPRKTQEKIEKLKIWEVRHKLGAHPCDYIKNKNKPDKQLESFVPIRVSLSGFNCQYLNNETRESENINLKECLKEHNELMISFLDQIYEKSIQTFYRGNQGKLMESNEKLKELRIEKEGGHVLKGFGGDSKLIIDTMRTKI